MASSALNAEHWLNKQWDNGTIAGFVTWRKWSHNSAHTGCGDVRGSFSVTLTLTNTGTQTEQLKPPFYTQRKLFFSWPSIRVLFILSWQFHKWQSTREKKWLHATVLACFYLSLSMKSILLSFWEKVFVLCWKSLPLVITFDWKSRICFIYFH